MQSEADSLRSEVARQETLLSSVQRIEASLAAKSETQVESLQDEVKILRESKADDDAKHETAVTKLEGRVAELEVNAKDLAGQKEQATVNATKAALEASRLKVQVQELTLRAKTAEKDLKAARIKLGDVEVDTTKEDALEAKVESLTKDLESTKADLETAQKRSADYESIAKTNETQLSELTEASTKYKSETTSELERLRSTESSQREAVAELTKDLMSHREDKEKAVAELRATVDSLTSQLAAAKEESARATTRAESVAAEAKSYQLDAKNANDTYERELALHAEARTALRAARSMAEKERGARESAEEEASTLRSGIDAERSEWEAGKASLEQSLSEAKSRLDDMRDQNNLLHDQMTSLSATVEKFQSDRSARLVGLEADGVAASDDAETAKQLSDLRELLKFKQSECTMLEADLASARRASERERAAADLAKRSLEGARSELKAARDGGAGDAAGTDADGVRAQLKGAEEQLVLVRESNVMLREESQKAGRKVADLQADLDKLKSAAAPREEKMKNMEVERAALVAEKESLSREVRNRDVSTIIFAVLPMSSSSHPVLRYLGRRVEEPCSRSGVQIQPDRPRGARAGPREHREAQEGVRRDETAERTGRCQHWQVQNARLPPEQGGLDAQGIRRGVQGCPRKEQEREGAAHQVRQVGPDGEQEGDRGPGRDEEGRGDAEREDG